MLAMKAGHVNCAQEGDFSLLSLDTATTAKASGKEHHALRAKGLRSVLFAMARERSNARIAKARGTLWEQATWNSMDETTCQAVWHDFLAVGPAPEDV